jgi:general secretion pathway protein D
MIKTSTVKVLLPSLIPILQMAFCLTSAAQNVDQVAQREVERRQAAVPRGEEALARGRRAMQEKNFTFAHEEFRTAVSLLPDTVNSGKWHNQALDGFCDSGVKLAEQRIAEGNFMEAESILREVLDERYDPKCHPAVALLAQLQKPGHFNKTMNPSFIAKVEEVKALLADADGYYNAGRYDLAHKKYDQVLALDPYNIAARRGQEKIDNAKYHYGEEAYNETRGRQLSDLQKSWEEPIRPYGREVGVISGPANGNASDTASITHKLNTIRIPKVEFHDASVREAIDFIRQQAVANDPSTEGKKGVDIVLRLVPLGQVAPPPIPVEAAAVTTSPTTPAATTPEGTATAGPTTPLPARPIVAPAVVATSAIAAGTARINLELTDAPLITVLKYIADQAGLKVKVEPYAVAMIPFSEQTDQLITKRYTVPPEFFGGPLDVGYILGSSGGQSGQGGQGGQAVTPPIVATNVIDKTAASFQSASALGPGGAAATSSTQQGTLTTRQQLTGDRELVGRADAKTFLQSMGVGFPANASATFFPHSGILIVRNTADNLDVVDALVEQANASGPKQVQIEAKFVEITQNNLKELGFDWLLGQFNIGNHKVFGAGGTSGTGTPVNGANFPFGDANGNPIGQNPVTAGNRSGNLAISANAIDALLFPTVGASSAAPGIFGLAGIFTDPQFQVVIHALNQKKGVDLLSAPQVTTKSGQRAIIEIIREFRYPTTFTPPQVPSISSSAGTTVIGAAQAVPVVVTPTTPQTFETRNTGVTLEVEPVVGPDGTTIDLNLVPQVVEFEGFINYGSPINAVGVTTVAGISISAPVVLTENVINQPIFSTRRVTTSVSVQDGQTVVLGGLMREDVQKTEDRTPIIGDIQLGGPLFRTNVDQHIKRNLIIFVSAKHVTPYGQVEEEEEGLVPPVLPEQPAYKK